MREASVERLGREVKTAVVVTKGGIAEYLIRYVQATSST